MAADQSPRRACRLEVGTPPWSRRTRSPDPRGRLQPPAPVWPRSQSGSPRWAARGWHMRSPCGGGDPAALHLTDRRIRVCGSRSTGHGPNGPVVVGSPTTPGSCPCGGRRAT